MRSLVAGAASSGISCPVPRNEMGFACRTDNENAVPKQAVSSSLVNSRLDGRKI
jgi:hypothetical protein